MHYLRLIFGTRSGASYASALILPPHRSFGNVLFELAARQPLFIANGDDSLDQFELKRLAKWSLGDLASAIDTLQTALSSVQDRGLVLASVEVEESHVRAFELDRLLRHGLEKGEAQRGRRRGHP